MGILVEMVKRHYAKKESQPSLYWCEVYKVRGINPETNRKKTVEVIAASNAPAEQIQSKSGLLPPYEIEKATRPATDAQLETMHKHGFKPPSNLSMQDASIFITRSVEGETLEQPVAPIVFIDYAIKNNVYIPKYANIKEAQDYLIAALPEKKKEIKSLK
ncbi:MAG: hypothetical protein K1W25_05730 [Lachnospiraceae bacterium]